MNEKYDIFISYSRNDLKKVKAIKVELENTTHARCWMDLEGIESGVPRFTKNIIDDIKNTSVFLFIRSKDSQSSEFALRELRFATKNNKSVSYWFLGFLLLFIYAEELQYFLKQTWYLDVPHPKLS